MSQYNQYSLSLSPGNVSPFSTQNIANLPPFEYRISGTTCEIPVTENLWEPDRKTNIDSQVPVGNTEFLLNERMNNLFGQSEFSQLASKVIFPSSSDSYNYSPVELLSDSIGGMSLNTPNLNYSNNIPFFESDPVLLDLPPLPSELYEKRESSMKSFIPPTNENYNKNSESNQESSPPVTKTVNCDSYATTIQFSHLKIMIPSSMKNKDMELILKQACRGLLNPHSPNIFISPSGDHAVVAIPDQRVEAVLYKDFIEDRENRRRMIAHFIPVQPLPFARVTMNVEGARFGWIKAQTKLREAFKVFESRLKVFFQTISGAEYCKIHIHYVPRKKTPLLQRVQQNIIDVLKNLSVVTLPIHIPEADRYRVSISNEFRQISYNHRVSLWTRTQQTGGLKIKWCTLASDSEEELAKTCADYEILGNKQQWRVIKSEEVKTIPLVFQDN